MQEDGVLEVVAYIFARTLRLFSELKIYTPRIYFGRKETFPFLRSECTCSKRKTFFGPWGERNRNY